MKSRIWLIAAAAIFAAVYVLPISVFAQVTDTTRQAQPDTLQQTPEDRPQQTPEDRPQQTPEDRSERTLEDSPAQTPDDTLRQTRTDMPRETPGETSDEAPGRTPQASRTASTTSAEGVLRSPTTGIKAFSIDLSGDAAVPGPGAEGDGSAFVVVHPERGEVCFSFDVGDISRPTDAHLHEGAAGVAGGPVVDFGLATRRMGGCVTNVDVNLAKRIAENPSNFYVNVHNEEFPQGALRGQLMTAAPRGS